GASLACVFLGFSLVLQSDRYRSAGFPIRPPIFNQLLPAYDHGHKSSQHQRRKHHLNDRETGRVTAKEPACNNAPDAQKLVGGPSEPIEHLLSGPVDALKVSRNNLRGLCGEVEAPDTRRT